MKRYPIPLFTALLAVLLSAILSIVINYVTSPAPGRPEPKIFGIIREWSLPLLGITLLLLCGIQIVDSISNRTLNRPRWNAKRPPYPGLEAFTEQDAGVFFGRDRQVEELADRLHPVLTQRAHRFVAVIGPSGSGKSSLVQAGLIPRLARERHTWTIIPTFTPEKTPIGNLISSVTSLVPDAQIDVATFTHGKTSLSHYIYRNLGVNSLRSRSTLLIIDQAEELFVMSGREERSMFLEIIRKALDNDKRLWVVATIRSEFLTKLLNEGYHDLCFRPVVIGSISDKDLFRVIEGPAAEAGLRFSPPHLVNRIVEDTGGGDALPLLAYTLNALYLRSGRKGEIREQDYLELGGVAGALTRQADKVAHELESLYTKDQILSVLLKFVALDEVDPTRRRVLQSALKKPELTVVGAFIEARLLTSDGVGDDAIIQVAHEAIFRQWLPLRQAIEAQTESLRQRSELERWAQDWLRSGRKQSYLLGGERLQAAQNWESQYDTPTDFPLIYEFLLRSSQVDRDALERRSEAIANQALAVVDRDPEHSILLALTAIEECAPTPLAYRALLSALAMPGVLTIFRGHRDGVRFAAWSPDGSRIATASDDGTTQICALDDFSNIVVLVGHEDAVWSVAWSPDGAHVATASADQTVRIWKASTGFPMTILRGHQAAVRSVAWSPDNIHLVTGSADQTVRIWNAVEGSEEAVFFGHEEIVRGVAWSPNGLRIASASGDRSVSIWSISSGKAVTVLRGHEDWVWSVAWSPDGHRLVTGSADRTVRIWDSTTFAELTILRGHQDAVRSVDWSADGYRVASASDDRTVRIWNADTGTELKQLRGHTGWVRGVSWSPDGQQLATASVDRTTRIWGTSYSTELLSLRGHTDWVFGVAWSPDGSQIVSVSRDGTTRVWDGSSGSNLSVLRDHSDWVYAAAWAPDGERLATASRDSTTRVWHISEHNHSVVLAGHQDEVWGVAWSPDGHYIATASRDRTLRLWDTTDFATIAILGGHNDSVRSVAWSPDGQWLASTSYDRTIRVWNLTGSLESPDSIVLAGHSDWIWDVAWSPDSRFLASASSDQTARIWNILSEDSDAMALILQGHEDIVRGVSWSRDGLCVATAADDRTVRLWRASDGIEIGTIGAHEGAVEKVACSSKNDRIVTASHDCTARVWNSNFDPEQLKQQAHRRIFHSLTIEERRSFLLPENE